MIRVTNLSFSYSRLPFLQDISFSVSRGEIFGFLGPSGAGKSTLQKILIGLIPSYAGSAVVNGTECRSRTNRFYQEIGVDFEFPSLYEKLSARQNLAYFGSLYDGPLRDADDLLAQVGLLGDADKRVSAYSKGMKSRLNFVKALLHDPEILFLDEPTSGLDPSNSRIMKQMILREREKGKTVILTTHNMLDAAELCDQVAFLVSGKIRALDSPRRLILSHGAAKLRYSYLEEGRETTRDCPLSEAGKDPVFLSLLRDNRLLTVHSSEPSLDDIFLEVTGRALQ